MSWLTLARASARFMQGKYKGYKWRSSDNSLSKVNENAANVATNPKATERMFQKTHIGSWLN